ncbi:(d)CMP kinase [Aquimarina agarilytica]|uniref:(d)CMP kinase n=1 Tax=Aquimarina agarilytica TaxID=1087449 RepID=UPI0002898FD8|nr:(d)CMP kinase [Aquimarina agarilytica]
MNTKIIIAIDGHSSTGKSTVAKQLAEVLGYTYVDTGAMYRAVAWYAMQNGIIVANELAVDQLKKALSRINIRFKQNPKTAIVETYVNDQNVESFIRSIEVSKWVSKVAAISEVRKKLVEQQQQMGVHKGIVMDGRDIGSVVFPNAELKLFMTASAQVRAQRRYDEMKSKGEKVTFEEVLNNVIERDHIDSTRKDSPLIKAADAIVIDNSDLSRTAQFNKILELVNQAM